MTGRFSESARLVVVAAEEEARNRGNSYVGTEHVLLGLLDDRLGSAVRTLEALDIGIDDVRQRVEDAIRPGSQRPSGQIPLTPRTQTVLQLAVQEAQLSGQDEVDTVDILLGLIREGTGVAAQVLIDCGAELVVARRAAGVRGPGAAAEIAKAVRDHSLDLTEAARNGELDPVIGLRREIDDLVAMLSQYFAPNPVLVYGPDADQRTVVAGLAMRIVAGNLVPEALEGKRVLALHVEQLIRELPAGPPDDVIPAAVAEITKLGDIVFCTDSLAVLMAGSADEKAGPWAILRALLATDEIKVIGVTSRRADESSEKVAFEKFEPIEIPEPVTMYDIGELKLALENARYFEA